MTQKDQLDEMPFKIGDRVTINSTCSYAKDFPGEWVIVGLRWEYKQIGGWINISIANDHEIERGYAETDGWTVTDFLPVLALS